MEMGKMVEQTLNGSLKTSAWGSDKVEALLSVEPGSDAAIAGISQHWGLLARVVTKEYGGDTKWGFVRQYVPTDDRSNKDTKFAILYEDGSEEALSLLELLPLLAKPPEYFRPSDEPNVFGSRSRQCPRDIKMLAASSSAPVSEIPGSPGPSNSRYLEASSASSAATPSRVGTEARPLARADAERGAEGDDAWGRRWKKRLRPPEVDVPLSGDDLHPMGKDVVWNKAKAAEVGASMPDEEKARIWELYKRHEAAVAYLQENITVPHVHLPEVYSPLRYSKREASRIISAAKKAAHEGDPTLFGLPSTADACQMYDDTSEQFKSAWQNWTRADCVYSQVYAKMLELEKLRTSFNNGWVPEKAKGKKEGGESTWRKAFICLQIRPDDKTMRWMYQHGFVMNQVGPDGRRPIGHLPGIYIGQQFESRTQIKMAGIHSHTINGIDAQRPNQQNSKSKTRGENVGLALGNPPYCTAICLGGEYEDNKDLGDEIEYTGQGACDNLGNKQQVRDQTWTSANLSLKTSMELKIPVRVVRKQKDAEARLSYVFVYEGLFMCTGYREEVGERKFKVIKFTMVRVPGQPSTGSTTVDWKGMTGKSSRHPLAGKTVAALDVSLGMEAISIPAVNDVSSELPPNIDPASLCGEEAKVVMKSLSAKGACIVQVADDAGVGWRPSLEYVTSLQRSVGVPEPEGAGMEHDEDHTELAKLNGGKLPYVMTNKLMRYPTIRNCVPMEILYECSGKCPAGEGCIYRPSQWSLKWRLEVFMTQQCGWSVRTWDRIPAGSPVCAMYGEVITPEMADVRKGAYVFAMAPRPDYDMDGEYVERSDEERRAIVSNQGSFGPRKDGGPLVQEISLMMLGAPYLVDAEHKGAVARFINHSCEPNLFAQPVCQGHTDRRQPTVVLFAVRNVSPGEELTYDYSGDYFDTHTCLCGAAGCIELTKRGGSRRTDGG